MIKFLLNKYSLDKKNLSVLLSFLIWLIVGFCIIFVGVNDVFASEYYLNYDTYQSYYDNTGTLTEVDINWNESLQSYISGNLTTVNNSTGAAWLVSSPIPMVKGHQYSISFAFVERDNIALSSKNKISISNTVKGAVSSYNNSTYNAETIYSKVTSNTTLSFVFKANSNSSFILIPFTTTSRVTQNYSVTMFIMEDLGTSGLSEEELNKTINSQTNILNNSIDSSKNEIINNQNQNNEELKDTIKDQFNDCRDSVNLIDKSLIQSGNPYYYYMYLDNVNELYTLSIKLKDNGISKSIYIGFSENNISPLTNYSWLMNDGIIGGINASDGFKYINNLQSNVYRKYVIVYLNNYTLDDLFDNYYIQLQKGKFTNYEPYGEQICNNKIDETNNQLGNLNNNITNDNIDDNKVSNAFNDFEEFIDENATISSLITLPVTLFTSILNGFQSSCVPFNLGSLYGENLILPCINISKYLGTTLWTMIDIIISGFAIYFISQKFIKVFNNFSSMKEGDVIND